MVRLVFFLVGCFLSVGLFCITGCSNQIVRPFGNLGDTVNSEADDFAPTIPPQSGSLYFTSNRGGSEDIWYSRVANPTAARPEFDHPRTERSDLSSLLSLPTTNDGTIVFTSSDHGFFASGNAPSIFYSSRIKIEGTPIGGTDVFEFSMNEKGVVINSLSDKINSVFWDSHPAAAAKGDSLLLVFSSDRPNDGIGFSQPYSTVIRRWSGEASAGNSDLYYAFRINGEWSPVRNFSFAAHNFDVNTLYNEYSPFIYCIDHRPVLLFASNRNESYDIWQAVLKVDFVRRELHVADLQPLPKGADMLNSESNELFPFVASGPDGAQYLYLASDRNQSPVKTTAGAELKSVGGYDIYRFPFSWECRPPRVTYRVTVLDVDDPARPVPDGLVRLYRIDSKVPTEDLSASRVPADHPTMEQQGSTFEFNLEYGAQYATAGGSTFDQINCDNAELVITGYSSLLTRQVPEVTEEEKWIWADTVTGATVRRLFDTTVHVDRIPLEEFEGVETTPTALLNRVTSQGEILIESPAALIRSVRKDGENLLVEWLDIDQKIELLGGRPAKYRKQVVERDTTYIERTDTIPMPGLLTFSTRTQRQGIFPLRHSPEDVVINDTIYVHPNYYTPPPCEWEYVRDVQEYDRNVPYFQTAFWEVNTSTNYQRHRRELASREYDDAQFIELHPGNTYFGLRSARRTRRLAEYSEYAKVVDRNLTQMARSVTDTILPTYLNFDAHLPGGNNKLVVEINAFSDIRPIRYGYFASDRSVEYTAGRYDPQEQSIVTYDVKIPAGTSLIGQSNDTLSKLRAYYGYQELVKRFEQDSLFKALKEEGKILMSGPGMTAEEFRNRIGSADIIILVEGRQTDESVQPSVSGYVNRENDFYELDDVRRIDVKVHRMEYVNGRLAVSPCCR